MQRSRMLAVGLGVTEISSQSLLREKKVLTPKAAPQLKPQIYTEKHGSEIARQF
jgi:hypothetical protein